MPQQPGADTIAAIATAQGRGGIGVVRVSGQQTAALARNILGNLFNKQGETEKASHLR